MVGDKKNGKEGMDMRLGGVKIEQSKTKKLFGIYINSKAIYLKGQVLKRKLQLFKNAILPLNILQDCQVFLQSFWQAQEGEEELCYSTKGTT